MRAAGIDYGSVRVGLAVADELGLLAHPRGFLQARPSGRLFEALRHLVADEGVGLFVVGLPKSMSGLEGPASRRVRKFAEELKQRTGVGVELWDERLTTVQARARLREQGVNDRDARSRIDSASAAVLLQCWLDGQPRRS